MVSFLIQNYLLKSLDYYEHAVLRKGDIPIKL